MRILTDEGNDKESFWLCLIPGFASFWLARKISENQDILNELLEYLQVGDIIKDEFIGAIFAVISGLSCWLFLKCRSFFRTRFRRYRHLGKYEGRWLQIIPGFSRPYSIIDLRYNKELQKYELFGTNFYPGFQDSVHFSAYRFIERTFRNGFYYITNYTSENKNGLGKLRFVESSYDRLIRADGYFFDASDDTYAEKHNTILIKVDTNFLKRIVPEITDEESPLKNLEYPFFVSPSGTRIFSLNGGMQEITPVDIVKASEAFAKTEINQYKAHHKKMTENESECICLRREKKQWVIKQSSSCLILDSDE